METSEYIVNTLKALVQFTQPIPTRYILGTFEMILELFLKNSQHVSKQLYGDYNEDHAEYIYNVIKMSQCFQDVPIGHVVEIFLEHFGQPF